MNTNLLTIDNMILGTTGTYTSPSKLQANGEDRTFHLCLDDKYSQVNSSDTPTTYNIDYESDKKLISSSPKEFNHSAHKKNDSENSIDTKDTTKPKEQSTASDKTEQPDVVLNRPTEQHAAVEQSKEGSPVKNKAKAGNQPAQMITGLKAYKSSKATESKVSSTENNQSVAEKGQSGLKTTPSETSMEQNGLKTILSGTTREAPAGKTQPGTIKNTDKLPVSEKVIGSIKEDAEKPPSVNPGIQTAQSKVIDAKAQSAGTDAKKAVPAAESDTKADTSRTLSNLFNTNGKETAHAELTANPTIQKLNIAAVQVTTGQSKGRDASSSNKSPSQGLAQILSQNNSQSQITEQLSASAKNASTTNPPARNSSGDVSADIGKQILESIHRSLSQQGADRQITIRLNPPELGKVFIKFQQQDTELVGMLEVSKSQTRFEIEQTLPQIIRNLADSGINIRRLDVTLSNEEQPGQGTFGNQSLQSDGAEQQYSTNPGMPGNDPDADQSNEWLAGYNGYENISELQDALITDGSINLLI